MKGRILFILLYTFSFASLGAQGYYLPPYYPTLNGLSEYAAWYLVYPDSLLYRQTPGEAVCTVLIDSTGNVADKQITATHPMFAKAAEKVIDRMTNWQPAWMDGRMIDTTVVFRIPFDPEAYWMRTWRQQQILDPCRGQEVDALPVFPDDIRKLVMGNMKWPQRINVQIQTAVAVCRFTVNEQGKVVNAQVLRGTHPAFDKEALRILDNFPRLLPALKKGKPVPYDYFLTINFWKLDLEYYLRHKEKALVDLKRNQKDWDPYTYSVYPGGPLALSRYVNSHVKITQEMKNSCQQGRVVYSFEVDLDGKMKNFVLVQGLSDLQNAEALRVLQTIDKKWSRGYYFNTEKWYREFYVNQYTIPVFFKW